MKTILYQIQLDEPVLAAALEGDPNSAVTHDYIPGSLLRGMMVGAYIRRHKQKSLDAGDPATRALFFDGQTRFLNGYPECEGIRALPTPLAWHIKKDSKEGEISDFIHFSPKPGEQWKRQKKPFFIPTEAGLYFFSPDRRLSVHNQRDRVMGRPTQAEGAVYRYIALLPGQSFQAAVVYADDTVAEALAELITGHVKLGGSRTGGYGLVTLKQLTINDHWVEASSSAVHSQDDLVVTLLSDALVRGCNGQYSAAPEDIASAIGRTLGCTLTLRDQTGFPKAFIDTRLTGGFNRKWGMPLPQAMAVKMGSVLVFERPALDQQTLMQRAAAGIGERREDGFGRIAIDWPEIEGFSSILTELPKKPAIQIDLTQDSPARRLAGEMLQRMVDVRFEAAITRRANILADQIHRPNRSQLARLIEFLQAALNAVPAAGLEAETEKAQLEDNRTALEAYLEKLQSRRATREQFQENVGGMSLLDWVRASIRDEKKIWEELDPNQDLPVIGDLTYAKTPRMAYQYNLRLVIAALAYAAKAKKE